MAKGKVKKTTKKTAKSKAPKRVAKSPNVKTPATSTLLQNLAAQLKLGESYVSLVLGAFVVFAIFVIFLVAVLGRGIHSSSGKTTTVMRASPSPTKVVSQNKTYVLQDGEGLWDVAVKFYGDGYKWTEIARANNLDQTADNVEPGTKLIIPNLK